jgi:hypothetical protein
MRGSWVKIFFFIGMFLLLVGVCVYGYLSYEGFQNPSSQSFCSADENKCSRKCSTSLDGDLPNETDDEMLLYDVYDIKNVEPIINPSSPEPKTTVKSYDTAMELSEFDPKAPMPWDYDNRQLDPNETVWGDINPRVSQLLYEKAYIKTLFGSANPSSFIENDNQTGQNAYRSNVFQTTVYGTGSMILTVTAEAFQDLYTSQIMEWSLKQVGLSERQKLYLRIRERVDASIPRYTITVPGLGNVLSIKKQPWARPTMSWAAAAAEEGLDIRKNNATQEETSKFLNDLESDLERDSDGKLTEKARAQLDKRKANIDLAAKQNIGAAVEEVGKTTARAPAVEIRAPTDVISPSQKGAFWKNFNRYLGTRLQPITTALKAVKPKDILKGVAKTTVSFIKKMAEYIAKLAIVDSILLASCASTASTATAQGIATGIVSFGATTAAIAAWVASFLTACGLASTFIKLIMVSLVSWIPVLMSLIVDESIALCPPDAPWNLKDAFYKLPGGEVGWELFSAIPLIGDVSYAIGPYICWGEKDSKPVVRLKQQVKPPYYYYDPTLSIYTMDKKYALVANPLDPTQFNQIASGVFETDAVYTNHYLYKDKYDTYPFLVDFSHVNMLNKMAQFYYDKSRKNMVINYDGTGTFEYISKIYGIISSSELSCDIQCEIKEITIDILYGKKLCERTVPVPVDAPAWYHDRRFYFYIDITKGKSLYSVLNNKCEDYLNHIQSLPTEYNRYPSCRDFSEESDKTECSRMLWNSRYTSLYDSNKRINFDLLDAAVASCNKQLLKTDGRENWNAEERMEDNMNKYIVTGCTHVNGTAPDVYDSKNLNVEGTQVGDTPVAVGPRGTPGGDKWHCPRFQNIPELNIRETGTPTDTSCNTIRSNFSKYGTTTRTGERASLQSQTANITNIIKAPEESTWPETKIIEWNRRETDITKSQSQTNIKFDKITKYMNVHWKDCPESDKTNCESSKRSFWMTLGVGSALGLLGSFGNVGLLPVGAVISGAAGVMGVQQFLNCLVEDAMISEGTFVQNGMLRTSVSGLYLIDHGPKIQFSPGYVPKININDPGLNMFNCANRYSVRKFINKFKNQFINYNLQNIFDISPRRKILSGNQTPCCVYGVKYTEQVSTGQNTVSRITSTGWVRMDMVLNNIEGLQINANDESKNVLLYRPYNGNLTMNRSAIPPIVPFTIVYGKTHNINRPKVSVDNIAPASCTRKITCNDAFLQERLFDQFNATHIGEYINYYKYDGGNEVPSEVVSTTVGTGRGSDDRPTYISPVIRRKTLYNNLENAETNVLTAIYTDVSMYSNADAKLNDIRNKIVLAAEAETQKTITGGVATTRWQTLLNKIDGIDSGGGVCGSGGSISDIRKCAETIRTSTQNEVKNLLGFFLNATTVRSNDGDIKCIFDLKFELNEYDDNNNIIITKPRKFDPPNPNNTQKVTMYLMPVEDSNTDSSRCLYDLAYDDYPKYIWYKKVPKFFFEVPTPPSVVNNNFKRGSATECIAISDCSSVELLKNLITQFNKRHNDKKINTVYRSFTPYIQNKTVCDYDVEILRSFNDTKTSIANQETVRFFLKPSTTNSCLYDLDTDESDNTNSGISLNNSQITGSFLSPFVWSSDFLYNIRKELYDSILPVLGLDIVNTVDRVSKTAKDTAKVIFNNSVQIQNLKGCPATTCRDPYILKKILNRYNFQSTPAYPDPSKYESGAQYKGEERKIVEFRRAGIASPTSCHIEFIENINTYDDFLYQAKPENRRAFLRQYKFDIEGTSCDTLMVTPTSLTNIQAGKMNIEGDPYGIDSEKTIVNPKGQQILKPGEGTSAENSNFFNYDSPVVNCVDPQVLNKVQLEYEKRDVSSPNVLPAYPAFNRIISVLEWFNPAPNICEYKMNIQHVYYDVDYGYYYSVPSAEQMSTPRKIIFNSARFSPDDTPSYIVAKWVPETDYDIESGVLKQNKPMVDEYFYPDLSLRDGNFYRTTTSTVPLNLPYLTGKGLSGRGLSNPKGVDYNTQAENFKIGIVNMNTQDQSTWTSCRYIPDQSISSTTIQRCSS